MHTLIKTSLALTFLVFSSLQFTAQNRKNNAITGSGNMIEKTVTTKPYRSIKVSGSMDVYLQKGTEGTISVLAEDNVQDSIVVESDGTTLTISMKNNTSLRNTKKIKITVPFEDISEISLYGSGSIEGKAMLKTDKLTLNLNGSGDIEIAVATNSLEATIRGSGDIEILGNATDVAISTTGSGDFEGRELISENAEVSITGSGDSTVYVKNNLKAKIQGSGSIYYGGKPATINSKVKGSGKIKAI